ncbi:MAG: ABC transporter substrate-binding protein [Bacillota bacterium]
MHAKRFGALLMALLMLLVAGCSGSKPAEPVKPEPAPAKKEPVTISYMTFSAAPDHVKDLDLIVKAFEAQNSDIKIEVQAVAWDQYWTKLQTAVSGGTVADTFELNYENFVTYAKKGALLDLTEMAKKDGLEKIFYPKAHQVFQYQGKQYGLVETFSTVLLFYNKDLFDKAKVGYPTASWTWKDEIEAAKKLTDAQAGVWGSYKPVQFWEFYKTIAQNGGKILDGDKVVIDSKENVEALQYLVDRIHLHKIQPTDAQMAGQSDGDLFKAGKIAMLHTGIWMFGAFKDAPFPWDIQVEPGNTQKAHHFFANAVAVSAKTKHAEAAYKWAKFLTSSPEAAKVRVDASWELPAVSDPKLVEGYLKQSPPATRKAVFDALNSPVVPPVIDKWNEMTDGVGKELEQAKLGKLTPAEALANAKKKLEDLMK